jgi:acyl-CoA synthetase (AMP-forming)/AMP-acid ligase II
MWRQDDLFAKLNRASMRPYPEDEGLDGVRRVLSEGGPGLTLLPACPLMHGTGGFTANECLAEGGRVVLLSDHRLNPVELLGSVVREKVNVLVIVGDPFARPILDVLDAEPGRFDLSSLAVIGSSGAMWSEQVKERLLRHAPGLLLIDAFSSSEAIGMGTSLVTAGASGATAVFKLGPEVRVLGPDGRDVEPGSAETGVLALGGRNPLGYYKDEDKTAATFQVIDDVRYSVPGDFAQVQADGTIQLLGRGTVVINTAGEQVFPEEVEEALKTHPAVRDAVVVGVPDERYGEMVVAAVSISADPAPSEQELIDHVKGRLAHFKAPRRVRTLDTLGRSPSGKLDYRRHRREAAAWVVSHSG